MSDDFEIEKVEEGSWEDLFNGEWERKNRPFEYFINYKVFKDKTLFGYFPYHVIFEFPKFIWNRIDGFLREVKWAYQRVYRGWDDRVVWSVDAWLSEIMPDILKKLKEDKQGVPIEFFDDPLKDSHTHEEFSVAKEKLDAEIDKMIAGFLSSKKIIDWNWKNKDEKEFLEKTFKEGMDSFIENYFALWD